MPRDRLIAMRNFRKIKLADSMNSMVGSWVFLVIHIIWFVVWLAWNIDINMLTMIVSLEAIILMILLLMDQNRQSFRDNLRDEADLQADLQSVDLADKILREVRSLKQDVKDLKK